MNQTEPAFELVDELVDRVLERDRALRVRAAVEGAMPAPRAISGKSEERTDCLPQQSLPGASRPVVAPPVRRV